ncbi:MAG: hypothetical protein NVS4B12_19990 [Ktedonobacteraceae bacterium]
MADLIGQQLGNYRIESLLGKGGFAEVYLGKHIYLNSFAALKVLHAVLADGDQTVFVNEARTLVSLHHPHIVRLLDYSIHDGRPFLVMEYAPGGTLRQRHPFGSRIILTTTVQYVLQIASALGHAHQEHTLIHRDIKPENMLVGQRGTLLLSDFGLALTIVQSQTYSTQQTQQPAGTCLYLAPEQFQGKPAAASDQYALAVVAYEWLSGKPPFSGTPLEIAMQHLSQTPPLLHEHLPDLPLAVEDVLLQALEKQPAQRFKDIEAFAQALEHASLKTSTTFHHYTHDVVPPEVNQPETASLSPSPAPFWKMPTLFTSLVGREQDVEAVRTVFLTENVRMVTLLGTGGIGKTRLSIQIAAKMREHFIDGGCFVPLAAVSDPERVIPAIAQELGIQDASTLPIFDQVRDFLHEKHFLLILDNFEQIVKEAPTIEQLLIACPRLVVLATSREVLHIQGEHEFPVAPLFVPDLSQHIASEDLVQIAAVALFLQRIRSVAPNFKLTSTNKHAIAEICVRLDGLPLAIELAAARIKLLSPQALLARLSQRFDVLTGGIQTMPLRQQTLRNTLKWSYDLLRPAEQRLFRRLAVFVGGWTIEAVEATCYYDVHHGHVLALDEIASLLDKSLLLLYEQEDGDSRLQMLMTVREYGLECLQECNETEQVCQAHALYYLAMAEEAEIYQLGGAEQTTWLTRLEQEHDNIRAALSWLSERQEHELLLRFISALCWFWSVRGHIKEGYILAEKALIARENVTASVRAKALLSTGALAYHLSLYAQTERFCQESLALYRQLEQPLGCASALYWLGLVACWVKQDYVQALTYAQEALALRTGCNDTSGMADALLMLAYIALNQGNYTEARAYFEQGLARFKEADDAWGIAYTTRYLARVLLEQGEMVQASVLTEESLVISIDLDYTSGIAYALCFKGHIALRQGNIQQARTVITESLAKHRERGQQAGIAESLSLLAKVALAEEKYEEAQRLYTECLALLEKLDEHGIQANCLMGLGLAVLQQGNVSWAVLLWGAMVKFRETHGIPMSPLEQEDYKHAETLAHMQLDERMFVALWSQGHTLTPEQALAMPNPIATPEPLAPKTQKTQTQVEKDNYPDDLTAREVEVLCLLAQGYTDGQIAKELVISPRTVNKHTTTIYSKIGVSSRSAATRYAMEHKLL